MEKFQSMQTPDELLGCVTNDGRRPDRTESVCKKREGAAAQRASQPYMTVEVSKRVLMLLIRPAVPRLLSFLETKHAIRGCD